MRLLARILTARISTKIVLPYLLLACLLSAVVTLTAARLTAGSLQERLDNRLIEAGQVTSDGLVATEDRQLEELRTIAFTTGVAEALAAGNTPALERLLRPIWANASLQSLAIFDPNGRPLIAWQRAPNAGVADPPAQLDLPDLADWWLVRQILEARSDAFGDKFSAFRNERLWTVAPIRNDGALVGGALVGTPLDDLLITLQSRSQASITTFYDGRGVAVATTQIVAGEEVVPAIPLGPLEQLLAVRGEADPGHVQDVATLSGRAYQLAYSPLRVRRTMDGFFAVGLPRSFIISTWEQQRTPLVALSLVLLTAVVAVGTLIARQITRPLGELVFTARAVAQGDLQRRSALRSRDELGVLSRAFNQMTTRLLHLYETSRALSAQPQTTAILVQTAQAVERIVPGAVSLAVLEAGDGWRVYAERCSDERLIRLTWNPLPDSAAVLALARRAESLIVAPANARRFRALHLPVGYAEAAYIALSVQGRLIGLLLLLHPERGAFVSSALEPLAAIAGMAASALNNVQLYSEVQTEVQRRTAILESIADGVLVCDERRNVVLMNPAAEALLGVRDWQRRAYRFHDLPLTPVADPAALHRADGRLAVRYACNGRTLSASFADIPGLTSAAGGEVIVLHDISAAAALDRAKTDLIALISHELRTPLTAIHSAADMLGKGIGGPLTPLQRELTDTALRQSQAMSALIEKAVLVAGIEMGTLELDLQPTGLRTIVDLAVEPLRGAADAADAALRIELEPDLPLVQADVRMVRFAVQQLVDNAIKYGAGAPIRIVARRHGRGVALAVRDFGPGIPPDQLPHLFERLRRHAGSLNEAQRGLGLGLVLVRELLERQGGAISVQSEAGQGALFTILLRVADQEPAFAAAD
jgi:signal transduction histidine kinase/HAMP domain-containing protein